MARYTSLPLILFFLSFQWAAADYIFIQSYESTSCTGVPSMTDAYWQSGGGCVLFPPAGPSIYAKVTCTNSTYWTLFFYSDSGCSVITMAQKEVGSLCFPSSRFYPQFGYRESATCVSGEYTAPQSGAVISQIYGTSCVEYPETITQFSVGTCILDAQSNEGFIVRCDEDAIRGTYYSNADCTGTKTTTLEFPYGCNLANSNYPGPWGRGDKQTANCYDAAAPQANVVSSTIIIGGAVGGAIRNYWGRCCCCFLLAKTRDDHHERAHSTS
jgi:hypothetical protein